MHGGDIYSAKIKHDFSVNVNPFSLPFRFHWKYVFSFKSLTKYPDLHSTELINEISKCYGVPTENIIAGNGASEIIFSIVRAANPKKAILPIPCFTGYKHALDSIDSEIAYFPLDEKDGFVFTEEKISKLKEIISKEKPQMLFLCNPNNPNGILVSKEIVFDLIKACKNSGTILLLDECFMKLTGKTTEHSLIKHLDEYENLVIVNALTKTFAVPGLRLGFCFCGSNEMAAKIKGQLPEWNVSGLAQKLGTLLLQCSNDLQKTAGKLSKERKFLSTRLDEMGFKVYPSDSNFILFYAENELQLKEKLLEKKILIRDCRDYNNLGSGYYRIAVKTHKENKKLLSSIRKVMGEKTNGKH